MNNIMISYAASRDTLPGSTFFLRHVVMMNYGGKVYCVLKCIEMTAASNDPYVSWVCTLYAVFMTLGMYWYTRYWHLPQDIQAFYGNDADRHVLNRFSTNFIILGATFYYSIFATLFGIMYNNTNISSSLSICIWNVWCALNLLLAIDRDSSRPDVQYFEM